MIRSFFAHSAYWTGHVCYLLCDRVFGWSETVQRPFFVLYQKFMSLSDSIQGETDNGPWQSA